MQDSLPQTRNVAGWTVSSKVKSAPTEINVYTHSIQTSVEREQILIHPKSTHFAV